MKITRERLNTLFCEFYNVPNDCLQFHDSGKVHYTKGQASVLFLDELNRSALDTRNAAMQLILEKRMNTHRLPIVNGKQTQIIAAINPADSYQVDELDDALLDRFLHVTIEPDTPAWLDWARSENINPIVRDFLTENPKKIHFQPKDGGVGASPRSWTKLASFVDVMNSIPPEVRHPIMKGKIGSALASEFLTYFNSYSKALKLQDVEKHITKMKKKHPNDIQAVGDAVKELIKDQEIIQKTEMAKQFIDKYIDKTQAKAYPMLAFLYALDLEIRASVVKGLKADNMTQYSTLAKLDGANNKELFRSIANVALKEQD